MNRRLLTKSIFLTVCALLIAVIPAFAGATTKSLSTNYTVVNLGTTDATVTASYYKDNGTVWTADPDKTNFTVPANYGQKGIKQYFDNTLTAGKGSVVLSSTEPLAAVVQIQARNQTPSSAAYLGYNTGSNKFYVPLVQRKATTASGTANTQIMIQNIGADAISATVDFIPFPGTAFTSYSKPISSIPAYTTYYYDVTDESASNLADGWYGSAVVTAQSGKQVAVVVNLFYGSDGLQSLNAFPEEMIGSSWAVPQFTVRLPSNNFSTPVNVQNVSGSTIAVGALHLDCVPGTGYTGNINVTNTSAIPNNALYSFNPVTDMSLPANWNGACVVSHASANLVVFIQIRRPVVSQETSAYEAFLSSSTNSKAVIPLVAKRLSVGFSTVTNIMNLDATNTAYLDLTFTRSVDCSTVGNATYTQSITVGPKGNYQINMKWPNEPIGMSPQIADNWCGSLVVTTTSGHTAVPIVSYVQLVNQLNSNGDQYQSHQAFILPEP